jgi:hypothetical protein
MKKYVEEQQNEMVKNLLQIQVHVDIDRALTKEDASTSVSSSTLQIRVVDLCVYFLLIPYPEINIQR